MSNPAIGAFLNDGLVLLNFYVPGKESAKKAPTIATQQASGDYQSQAEVEPELRAMQAKMFRPSDRECNWVCNPTSQHDDHHGTAVAGFSWLGFRAGNEPKLW